MNRDEVLHDFRRGRCAINFDCQDDYIACLEWLDSCTTLRWGNGSSLLDGSMLQFRTRGIRVHSDGQLYRLTSRPYRTGDFGLEYVLTWGELDESLAVPGWNSDGFLSLLGGSV